MGKRLEQELHIRRHMNGQQTYNIISHQGK